jgi:uncharacterized membrane protein YbjE (DUF340 family)
MKISLILLGFFVAGVGGGLFEVLPHWLLDPEVALYSLYGLLVLVGLGIGCDTAALQAIFRLRAKTLLVPAGIALGSLAGSGLISLPLGGIEFREAISVGAGFGYYSLSSVLTSQLQGEQLGAISLLANMLREVLTLVLAPQLAAWFGDLAPIASGGATSMDTTLPVISRTTSKHYAMIAVISGIVLSLLVPILVPAILS